MEVWKLAKEPRKLRLRKIAKPQKLALRVDPRHIAIIIGCVVAGVGAYMFLTKAPSSVVENVIENVRVGESQTYGIYVSGIKVGSLTSQITGTAIVGGVECYVARYGYVVGDGARWGELKFDNEGNLRRATVEWYENFSSTDEWWNDSSYLRTDVGYFSAGNRMDVIIEDNSGRYENRDDNNLLPGEIMVPEHVWYLLRFESLYQGYRKEFFINALPDATQYVPVAFQVVGDNTLKTQAGDFDCWVIEGENTQLTSWPIDNLWVAKDTGVVVKAIELQDSVQFEYVLLNYG